MDVQLAALDERDQTVRARVFGFQTILSTAHYNLSTVVDIWPEFGRMGEGPGEFSWPNGYAVLRDGTTVVVDARHDALQLFAPSETFIRMVRTPDELGMTSGIQGDPRGGAVLTESWAMNMGSGTGWTTRPVLRLSLAGDVVQADTAAEGWLPDRPTAAEASEVARSFGLGSITQPAVFEPALLFGVLPDGTVVHSDSSAYHLKLTPPDASRVERVITRPISPRPVTPAVLPGGHDRAA